MSDAIGIDLGTTFSAAARVDESGRPVIVPNNLGKPITPSVIYLGGSQPVVGEEAKEMQALGEQDVAFLFKRNMGDSRFVLNFGGKDYSATDLSAIMLQKIKTDCELALGRPVTNAVITVPAYFNNHQRDATIQAGSAAGLEVLRIINEPTAAALAYGFKDRGTDQNLLVYDLGGGTFDVTIVSITADGVNVRGTSGDHQLGGRDWDDRIVNYLNGQFEEEYSVDPLADSESAGDLLVRCETAKKQLSTREKTRVTITHDGEKGVYELSRTLFEELTCDLMERTQRLTERALSETGMNWRQLDGVLLVGGSARMPMVHDYVESMSGKKPLTGVNVDEAVAMGAAIQAAVDLQPTFPLSGAKKITDVMSHSLGMVAVNEDRSKYINSIIIPKNMTIPCVESRPFQLRTAPKQDNFAEVYMLQGETTDPTHCTILGKYTFSGITHVKGNPAVLDIAYAYDRNGVVTVSAAEKSTGATLPLSIEPLPEDMAWLGFPPKEPQEMVQPHLSVLIAIDLSGSMTGDPLLEAQKAAEHFLKNLDLSHTSVGLIGFADQVSVTQDLCQDARVLQKGIKVWTKWMTEGTVGYGNSAEPFSTAFITLETVEDPRFLIVLTDGCWFRRSQAISKAKKLHAEGVEIIALGFGGADHEFLKAIATSDENALFTDLSQLTASFSKIAQVLTESGGGRYSEEDPKKRTGLLSFFK